MTVVMKVITRNLPQWLQNILSSRPTDYNEEFESLFEGTCIKLDCVISTFALVAENIVMGFERKLF